MIYNVVLILDVQQSEFVLHIHISTLCFVLFCFFRFFSHIGCFRVLSRVPCDIQQILLSYLFYILWCTYIKGFPGDSVVKKPPLLQRMGSTLGQENPLEKEMTTHSSILAWEIQ